MSKLIAKNQPGLPLCMRFMVILAMLILSGCVKTVIWDGYHLAYEHRLKFIDANEVPLKGVVIACHDNGVSPGSAITEHINTTTKPSNDHGMMLISHPEFMTGGSYKQLGTIKWAKSPAAVIQCDITHNGALIHSGLLSEFEQLSQIQVKFKQ